MKHLKFQQGFTLIEMVIVIVILGIIASMSSQLLMQGLNTFTTGENIVNANWQGQIAIERMSRDISLIRSPTDISNIASNNFAFTDVNNNTLTYSLSGTDLVLTQNGSNVILARGIQSLTFTYFDKTGASTGTASSVRLIGVSINVTGNNVNYTLSTMIYPRNLS